MSKSATINKKAPKQAKKAAPKTAKPNKATLPSKVAYFILYVPDMMKAIEFYKSIGLKATYESPEWSEFDAGIKFALHGMSSCGSTSSAVKPIETNISFGVKDAKATYETFKAMGIKVHGEPHQVCEEGGYCFGFEDCFGNVSSIYG